MAPRLGGIIQPYESVLSIPCEPPFIADLGIGSFKHGEKSADKDEPNWRNCAGRLRDGLPRGLEGGFVSKIDTQRYAIITCLVTLARRPPDLSEIEHFSNNSKTMYGSRGNRLELAGLKGIDPDRIGGEAENAVADAKGI